jgi:hypothetical protein
MPVGINPETLFALLVMLQPVISISFPAVEETEICANPVGFAAVPARCEIVTRPAYEEVLGGRVVVCGRSVAVSAAPGSVILPPTFI